MNLAIRTDKPESELYLLDGDGNVIEQEKWQAHRKLASTLHIKIEKLLNKQSLQLSDISTLLFYEGPGSFTGLRIGAAVTNSIADSYGLFVVNAHGEDWLSAGHKNKSHTSNKTAIPKYGSAPHITTPRK